MTLVAGFLALAVLLVVAGVVVAGVLALRGKAAYEASSRLGPNLSSAAPTSWAGSHDPEARLHRRLRDALAALTANQAFDDDGRLLDIRVELEQQAVALDDQLVATAALPLTVRSEPLQRIAGAVASLEQAVADLAGASASEAAGRLTAALDDIRFRTGTVAQARAALDALPAAPSPGIAEPTMPTTSPPTAPPAASPPADDGATPPSPGGP